MLLCAFLKAFPGPRGRPDLKKRTPKNPARLPSGTHIYIYIYPMLCSNASEEEIGLPGRVPAGILIGKTSICRPSTGRRAGFEALPTTIPAPPQIRPDCLQVPSSTPSSCGRFVRPRSCVEPGGGSHNNPGGGGVYIYICTYIYIYVYYRSLSIGISINWQRPVLT